MAKTKAKTKAKAKPKLSAKAKADRRVIELQSQLAEQRACFRETEIRLQSTIAALAAELTELKMQHVLENTDATDVVMADWPEWEAASAVSDEADVLPDEE